MGYHIQMQECTHPDCPAKLQEWITEVHCQKYHGMTKAELQEKYGDIVDCKKEVRPDGE